MNNNNFYVFEVLDTHYDSMTCNDRGTLYKGERFIGWESTAFNGAVKSNTDELVIIPSNKVKKLYKIKFEEVED